MSLCVIFNTKKITAVSFLDKSRKKSLDIPKLVKEASSADALQNRVFLKFRKFSCWSLS